MNRRNQILAGVLAVQIVIALIVFWPRASAAGGQGQALFPGLTADKVTALTVSDGKGQSLRLAKANGNWVLPDAGDYPAKADAVTGLLGKIVALKANQPVTQTSGSLKRLKVADDTFEARIDLELSDGSKQTLYLGSSPSYGAVHVRAGGQDQVYLARDLSSADAQAQAAGWVDTAYLSVPSDQIVGLTLVNANGRFEFVKENGKWTLAGLAAGETLDENTVQALATGVASVLLVKPLGKEDKPEYGLASPAAVLTVKTHTDQNGDKTYTLQVGAKDTATNNYTIKSSESPYYVQVSDYTVKDWVEKTRDGFLLKPPTPAPAAAATATP